MTRATFFFFVSFTLISIIDNIIRFNFGFSLGHLLESFLERETNLTKASLENVERTKKNSFTLINSPKIER